MNDQDAGLSRREFMARLAMLGSLLAVYPARALDELRSTVDTAPPQDWRAKEPWKTIAAVQEHLFPAGDDVPGASDFQALVYLRNSVENPAADSGDREFIANGVGWLNDLTHEHYQQPFTALDAVQRETVLRQIERSRAGRNWLSLLLTYLLEALLADPVYGGNPDGIGWDWLEHQPGFPTPQDDKAWFKLGAPVYYRRKA